MAVTSRLLLTCYGSYEWATGLTLNKIDGPNERSTEKPPTHGSKTAEHGASSALKLSSSVTSIFGFELDAWR